MNYEHHNAHFIGSGSLDAFKPTPAEQIANEARCKAAELEEILNRASAAGLHVEVNHNQHFQLNEAGALQGGLKNSIGVGFYTPVR